MLGHDLVDVFGKCRKQGLIREDVDTSHQALCGFGNETNRSFGKKMRAKITGCTQTENQILANLVFLQWAQIEAMSNALPKLPNLSFIQIDIQRSEERSVGKECVSKGKSGG